MKIGKGMITGLGIASLLVALPAYAGGSKASGSSATGHTSDTGSSSAQGSGSGSMGSTGSSGSSGSMGSMGSDTAGTASGHQITGKVDKFDQTSKELTLSLKVSENTQVLKDGQRASLSDIKEGDQVRASFSGSGESLQVNRIEVMSSGSTGSSPSGSSGSPSGMGSGSTDRPGSSSGSPGSSSPGSSGSSGSSASPGSGSGRGY